MNKMNYKEINEAILNDRDINEELVKKNDKFYQYLFNNKVAYFYSKYLSKNQTEKEKWIIKRGEELNKKYYKTLKLLKEICDENNIDFLLYKTYKQIPEVVDGDIDIFVKREDFYKFLEVFRKEGFKSVEDCLGKGKCTKEGCLVIEPHIGVSWRGDGYISEDFIWENLIDVCVKENLYVKSASFEVELISLISKVYFEPSYLDSYGLKQIKALVPRINLGKIYKNISFVKAFKYLMSFSEVESNFINKKLPLFLDNVLYLKFWSKQAFPKNLKIYFLHILFFFYWKYRYFICNKLPFNHTWNENK
jgi:hypothetical protein